MDAKENAACPAPGATASRSSRARHYFPIGGTVAAFAEAILSAGLTPLASLSKRVIHAPPLSGSPRRQGRPRKARPEVALER